MKNTNADVLRKKIKEFLYISFYIEILLQEYIFQDLCCTNRI